MPADDGRKLAALMEMIYALAGPARLEQALEAGLRGSAAVDGALVALVDGPSALRRSAAIGTLATLPGEVSLRLPGNPFAQVIAEGTPRYLTGREDIRAALRIGQPAGIPDADLPAALLILPLSVKAQCAGILALAFAIARSDLSPGVLQWWESIAALCALASGRARGEETPAGQVGEEHDRLRAEVMATLSHELRTPLSTIKGCATALLIEEIELPEDEQREFLRLIDEECDNMQIMISDLMDSALIDVGKLALEPDLVRLPNLAQEMVGEVQGRTSRHVFVVSFPSRFPLLKVDPHWIRQVFRNILDNAVKYSPEGGMIVIQAEAREKDVVVSIVDQGVGIAAEDLIPLFDKYFRVKSATGPHVAGTGLGLPVARAIVEAHGGRIWADSKVGQGTTISFSLPLSEENALLHNDTQRG